MSDWINYPAIFTFDGDGISVHYPDIEGCFTCGDDVNEAIRNAKEALGLHLYGIEKDNEDFPTPSKLKEIVVNENQSIVIVEIYLPIYRDSINNKSVKKTLTIPKWLNELAEDNNINFSRVLQDALKKYLGVY